MSEKVTIIGPDDPLNIPRRLEEHRRQMDSLAASLETKSVLGRFIVLYTNPRLREHMEYRAAQQSIVDARRRAGYEDGQIVW